MGVNQKRERTPSKWLASLRLPFQHPPSPLLFVAGGHPFSGLKETIHFGAFKSHLVGVSLWCANRGTAPSQNCILKKSIPKQSYPTSANVALIPKAERIPWKRTCSACSAGFRSVYTRIGELAVKFRASSKGYAPPQKKEKSQKVYPPQKGYLPQTEDLKTYYVLTELFSLASSPKRNMDTSGSLAP